MKQMEVYISLIFYCFLVVIVLYILWQCVFQPFRRYQEQQIRRFTELYQDDEEEIDLELGERADMSLTSVDSDEIEEKI